MPYSLLRKVFCPIIFWQTTQHRVWGFLPSPGEASAAKAKSRKSKDSKKTAVPEKALGRPAQQHRTFVSHMVPHSSKTGKLILRAMGGERERMDVIVYMFESGWCWPQFHIELKFLPPPSLFFWTRSQEKSVEKSGPEAENWRDMLLEVYEELKAWPVRLRNLLALVKQGGAWKPSLLWSDPSFWLFKK